MNSEFICLLMAGIAYWGAIILSFREASRRIALYFIMPAALIVHLASAIIRWVAIGHPPVFGTYEATLAASWFMPLTALLAVKRHRQIELIIPWTALFALLHLAYGFTFNTARIPITISEQSIWVDLHAMAAWLAYGELFISFLLSLMLLMKTGGATILKGLPSEELMDELIFKYLVLGFIFHTLMFALGSYYSSTLFGKWWTWDPVDTLFMISWIIFGLIVHMRLFYGWKNERMAKLVIIGMITIFIGYWSLVYIPWATYHIFDIGLKMHG
ncbi:MAG: cytochrome c biogenesis protein CcsA [bacterium]|nr:cytochrome c biogenesis protein CcsA [bacterium]